MAAMNFKICMTVIALAVIMIAEVCHSKSLISPNKVTTPGPPTTKRTYTCVCDDNEQPLCANNGVTYKNKCRFECAASKMDKLRMLKEGECGKYISKLNFNNFG